MDSEMRGDEGFPDGLDYESRTHDRRRRVIMALLVDDVYKISNRRPRPQCYPYEMVNPIEANGNLFGAVYKSRLDHNIVVAFRGTMNEADLMANIHIFFRVLRSDERYGVGLSVLKEQVNLYGPSKVCLAGHSQGAALALLMGRELAEGEGRTFLEAHLFNPPHPAFLRLTSSKLAKSFHNAHMVVTNLLWYVLQDESTLKEEKNKLLSIRDWLPQLYINDGDVISSGYLTHFQTDHHHCRAAGWLRAEFPDLLTTTPRSFRGIFQSYVLKKDDSPSAHLIPSACLHLNVTNPSASNCLTERYIVPHKLDQWWDFNLEVDRPCKIQFDLDKDCMVIVS